VVVRIAERLGRPGLFDFPDWWHSFMYAADYAGRYDFDKLVHVESDTYLLSPRLHQHVNGLEQGWTAFWCP
jgi:hypothetical protein